MIIIFHTKNIAQMRQQNMTHLYVSVYYAFMSTVSLLSINIGIIFLRFYLLCITICYIYKTLRVNAQHILHIISYIMLR